MNRSIIIHDETAAGSILNQLKLRINKEKITVKELIRMRVYQEVEAYNTRKGAFYRGLVRPNHAKPTFSGFELNPKYKIDPQKQYYVAMDAFKRQSFHLLVDDERVEDPEQPIDVRTKMRVSFMKLAPLVGG